ncbi:iron-siderophore ABC transporter substrate-binding protein [Arenibaculum pallidiluteum]|uniref:iron-siderophore ABC transporter substrate-binding protein n=1 Tax=Arenibaculum pallidiluteum TaxID=2812559 RepID=UPI001A95AA99|nr:iron-siderophore ABC transporter substrate-binding protein [Arenibaculum pallidiluteum]
MSARPSVALSPPPPSRRPLSRRQALGLAAAVMALPARARAGQPRIAAIDWAALETALAIGVVPVAATELIQFRRIAVEPEVPDAVMDIGLRGTPNYEALRLAEPDLILISDFYERQRAALERIAPLLSLTVYRPGVPPYARAAEATLTLARALDRDAQAQDAIARADREIARIRAALEGVPRRPVFVINIGDARHFRAFGTDSMFGDVLGRLGFENAWTTSTSYAAAAPLGVEHLAGVPDAGVLVVGPVPPEARRTLFDGALWNALPMVRDGRVSVIEPINHFGGLPAATRFARLAADALRLIGQGHG